MQQQTVNRIDLRHHDALDVAILSDTHGDIDPGVEALVRDADIALHAGDIMGGGVLDRLQPKLGKVISVRGNNDVPSVWRDDSAGKLAAIPDVALVELRGGLIAMEHGHLLYNIEIDQTPLGYKYADARMMVYGHTHVEKLDQDSDPWLLNPGAAGMVRNQGGASCYLLKIRGDDWNLVPWKFPPMRASA